ncbi:MAG: HD-GYP domain-containing protein [Alcanivoracaceae bacterium]|nr:HD-GYP domain-containing protein [Alcanivoracaceae bacterium]
MSIKVEQVSTQDLQLGMYVSQLDRPWIETPFPMQGFHIRSQDDIEKLRAWCKHIYIDLRLGTGPVDFQPVGFARPASAAKKTVQVKGNLGKFTPVRYAVSSTLKKEVAASATNHREVTRAVVHLLNQVREGKPINFDLARKASRAVVASIVRNPDAMVWLARLKDKDSYSYNHSIRCAILAAVFGRHIGLPVDVLENLVTGVMVMDIGNARLPRKILNAEESTLEADEKKAVKDHVQHSLDILEQCDGMNDQIMAVVQYHHERHDGSGYPFGLQGTQIPLLARIAGIVDTYDAITSPRPWLEARNSTEAVSILYAERDQAFQSALVEQFIQSIGVYPTGTIVELSNDEVGVVIAQNPSRRLRPQVLVVMDAAKQTLSMPHVLDLMSVDKTDRGEPLMVASCLKPGTYNLDLARIQVNAA